MPYFVLYPLGQITSGPPFGDSHADSRVQVQVTTVASTPEQAEFWASRAHDAVLGRSPGGGWRTPIVVPGGTVMHREADGGTGVDANGGVYSDVQRFVIVLTSKVA
ncbi:hypothetical protein ACIQXD_29645 [Streptomyces uncialis]|uniref:hypothetical protein n=1 Tax=Streptomyces uncialis TaxID=1048205 RepID=UPI00382F110B